METSSIKTPFPGWVSVPSSFVSLFIFYILSYLLSKTMGCFSRRLMTSAGDQKLFCEVCCAFNCSFNEFVGEKVVSSPYSSAVLAPSPIFGFLNQYRVFSRWVFDFSFYLPHDLSCPKDFSALSPELASATSAEVAQMLLLISGVQILPHHALENFPYLLVS